MNRVSLGLPWRLSIPQMRARRMLTFTFHLPLVGWWALFLGTVAFGCLLNVYKTYLIAESRLQLVRIEQEYTQQQQLNTELLFRIGEEADLNYVYYWAVRNGFEPQTQTLWLQSGPSHTVSSPPETATGIQGEAPPSADERIQHVSQQLELLVIRGREQLAYWTQQLNTFLTMPSELQDGPPSPVPQGERRPFWQRLFDSANLTGP